MFLPNYYCLCKSYLASHQKTNPLKVVSFCLWVFSGEKGVQGEAIYIKKAPVPGWRQGLFYWAVAV